MIHIEPYKQLKIPTDADRKRARRMLFLRSPYLFWGLLSYALIICMFFLYIKKQPVYTSDFALVLPGSGYSSSVNIEDVGTAKSQTTSPFSQTSFNPRVNYKEMLRSREVIGAAATQLGISFEEFNVPKVELTQQTSILKISTTGSSGEMARDKGWSLYEAFQIHLDNLRADEARRRDESLLRVLDDFKLRLNAARLALVEFQQRSMLVSMNQLDQVTAQLSQLDSDILYTKADLQSKEIEVNQLSYDLGVSPDLAGKAFRLQTDTQFMGHLRELHESAQLTSEYLSTWGRNHPKVKASQKRLEKAEQAALERTSQLLDTAHAGALHTINLSASPERASLFRQLIDSYSSMMGVRARLQDLTNSNELLTSKLKVLYREAAELERLQREYDLAEAVYTSAAADIEASKADVFASYPVAQLLASPTAPVKRSSPNPKLALAGVVLGILMITATLLILWQRHYIIARLLNRPVVAAEFA